MRLPRQSGAATLKNSSRGAVSPINRRAGIEKWASVPATVVTASVARMQCRSRATGCCQSPPTPAIFVWMSQSDPFPDDADGRVLAEIAARGADLSKPHEIEFAIDAPDETSAHRIHSLLSGHGFTTELYYDEGEPEEDGVVDAEDPEFGPSWTVYVRLNLIPSHQEIVDVQHKLDGLVRELGGKADGWGMMLD